VPVHVSRASSVIVHHVPAGAVDRFLALQEGFTQAVEAFPGYQGTDVYPPADPKEAEWVVLIHFTDAASLKGWLDSPIRAEWVAKVRKEIGEFRLKTLPTGFGTWFAGLAGEPAVGLPPGWKMALTVLLGLYPTVLLLTLTVGKLTSPLGMAVAMLIGNALSVSILQWGLMPVLTRIFGPWLHANPPTQRAKSLAGVAVIAALLAGFTIGFRQITG
jgi:antibiotic biosynthesis monooxygenase (ABM) superfamily enzyme